MSETTHHFTTNISFMPDWFEKHFFCSYQRPAEAGDEELERLYLERKRFLFEHFGGFGIGEEKPVPDGRHVNRISKFCCDFVPYLLGVKLECIDAGFYYPHPLSEQEIGALEPADIARYPLAEWILRRKEKLLGRYGSAEMGLYLEGSLNAAYRTRGEWIYTDLYWNRDLAQHLFGVINETLVMAYRFLLSAFDFKWVTLFNCTANHVGPQLYKELCLPNDLYVARETAAMIGDRYLHIHHCDLPVDKYLDPYAQIPGVNALDGSHTSDIKLVKKRLPGVKFMAMIHPTVVDQTPPEELRATISGLLADGADEFYIVHVDPHTGIDKLKAFMDIVGRCCEAQDYEPAFTMAPLCEEELEWAFPQYQGKGLHHRDDDWRTLVPRA